MDRSEHSCPADTFHGVPNNAIRIESWDVCFGGRVTGLMNYFDDKGMPTKTGRLMVHIFHCPFCGQNPYSEPTHAEATQ